MKNNLHKIFLALSVIFFIIFSFIYVFVFNKIKNYGQKTQDNLVTWQIEASKRDKIKLLDISAKGIMDDQAILDTHFIKSSDIVPFLDMIEKTAPSVGASAEIGSVGNLVNNTGLVVGVKVTGSFEAIYKFLNILENSPYELNFLSVDIHKLEVTDVPVDTTTKKSTKNLVRTGKWEAILKIQLLSFVP